MKLIVKFNMVDGLPRVVLPYGICKGCLLGKHRQATIEIGKTLRSNTQLEIIHNDLRTMNQQSLRRAKYVLTFIDDFSNYT